MVNIVHVRLEREIECDGDQQERQNDTEDFARDIGCGERSDRSTQGGQQGSAALCLEIHMAAASIGDRRRSRAEKALQLVGAEGGDRWKAGDQKHGNRDQSAATGNRINKACEEGCRNQRH